MLQYLLRVTGYHEVIRVPHHIHFQLLGFHDPKFRTEVHHQFSFQPVQRPFANVGEMMPPCGVPASVACSWPLKIRPAFNHFRRISSVHRDIIFQPVMADVVEAALDIRFQTHGPRPLWDITTRIWDIASAVERFSLNP